MGTSPNRSYPYPAESDAVDVPGDMEALADAVDTDVEAVDNAKADKTTTMTAGTGLSGGGDLSANRTLSVDFTAVATAAQGAKADTAVQPARTITAGSGLSGGGDLSADRTLAILPPLVSAGPKPVTLHYVAPGSPTAENRALVRNEMVFCPLYVWAGTLSRIGLEIVTAQASTSVRLGIYGASTSTGRPTGAALLDAGTVDASTTGFKEITISHAVSASGWYYLAAVPQGGSGANVVTRAVTGNAFQQRSIADNVGAVFNAFLSGFGQTGVTGALPTIDIETYFGYTTPRMFIRYSAVT